MLEVSGNGRSWRVIARPESERSAEALGLSGHYQVESGTTPTAQPRADHLADSSELVPAIADPNPERFLGWSRGTTNERSRDSSAHKGLEASNHILVRHADLKSRFESALVWSVASDSDMSLSLKHPCTPSDFGIGRSEHAAIV